MEKFKMDRENLLNVCRDVKNFINDNVANNGSATINVIYDTYKNEFYCTTLEENCIASGNCFYKKCVYYRKVTIKYLMWDIFRK